jgi:hypothetical protein
MEIRDRQGTLLFQDNTKTMKETAQNAIKARADLTGAVLTRVVLRGAFLTRAVLRDAVLRDVDLTRAVLRDAVLRDVDLTGADLTGADLRGADLTGVDLRGVDLRGVDLTGARNEEPLALLRDQPGLVRAYKLVNRRGEGPFQGGITYEIGESYAVEDADTDERVSCGAGINVATLGWCLKERQPGYRILIVEFEAKDIAAIPIGNDGKFRLHRCTVVGEKNITTETEED